MMTHHRRKAHYTRWVLRRGDGIFLPAGRQLTGRGKLGGACEVQLVV